MRFWFILALGLCAGCGLNPQPEPPMASDNGTAGVPIVGNTGGATGQGGAGGGMVGSGGSAAILDAAVPMSADGAADGGALPDAEDAPVPDAADGGDDR
jgi:hypothetical protein